ncbi:hypothetical protein K4K57_007272 [Colletotrichum sp. SAR 10_99]|nr:hypothetical protein K4K55_000483 [Colletotrichum sp. SAR 10_96]KAJ5017813.1 hypothetical protein K4K57_007272 [Colletotrichum sp. SAR 10_99]
MSLNLPSNLAMNPTPPPDRIDERKRSAFESFSAEIDKNTQWNATDVLEIATKRFPNQNVLMEFLAYEARRAQERVEKTLPKLTLRECMGQIEKTNFAHSNSRAEWHWIMEMVFKKFHPIGFATHGGYTTGYGIDPGPAYLLPHGFNPNNHVGHRLHHSLLGINLDLNIGIYDTDPGIPVNTIVTGSDHIFNPADTGFVFAQIGSLRVFNGPKGWPKQGQPVDDAYMRDGPWEETKFGVVVRIDRDGKPGAVYAIYNFWEHGKDHEGRDHSRLRVRDHKNKLLRNVGQPHPKCDWTENFTVAKIANNISELVPATETSLLHRSRKFKFDVQTMRECHICPAKQVGFNGESYLMRDSIKGPKTRWG